MPSPVGVYCSALHVATLTVPNVVATVATLPTALSVSVKLSAPQSAIVQEKGTVRSTSCVTCQLVSAAVDDVSTLRNASCSGNANFDRMSRFHRDALGENAITPECVCVWGRGGALWEDADLVPALNITSGRAEQAEQAEVQRSGQNGRPAMSDFSRSDYSTITARSQHR